MEAKRQSGFGFLLQSDGRGWGDIACRSNWNLGLALAARGRHAHRSFTVPLNSRNRLELADLDSLVASLPCPEQG